MDVSQLVNDLMDLERAGERRCTVAAALARTPQLRAELVLRGAEHKAEAERLHHLVVELRGTPHSGETTAVLADPLWFSPPVEGQDDRELLEACIAEEEANAARCQDALRAEGLPEHVKKVIQQCMAAANSRHENLLALRASVQ
jgi:uncharacterized protein (TIGR02284 family)